jgi:hypothetical protein
MADTPTTRGAYRKQGLGDRSAAWGLASGLNGVFDSMDEAIHGFNGVSLATVNYTLSSTNYTTNEVRQRFHRFTNGGISANATITVPATQNWWLISNAVSGFDLVVSNGSNSVTIDDGLTALVATDGTNVYEFPMFSTLVAPDPGSNGIVVRTALGVTVARTLTGPAAGITVTAGDGVSANPTLALANDLAAVEGLSSTGLAVRTASDTWAARTLTGPAAGVSVANGDGVSGNPTISLANDLSAVEGLSSNGIAVRTATDTWAVRTLTAGGGIAITHGDGISANPTVAVDINGSASAVGGVASDDEVLIFDTSASAIRKTTVATISGSGATTVSISANDTTPAVLATKLVAGTGITLTENNDGGNETLTVAAAGDVAGPGGSTDNAWARWSGSAGTAIQNGKWVEADTGAVTAGGDLDMDGSSVTGSNNLIEQGKHTIAMPAGAMVPPTTNGAAASSEELATNDVMIAYLEFDAATAEAAQFAIPMPKGWNEGTVTARFFWKHPATTTNFGVVWGIRANAVSNDDALDASWGTAVTVTDTGGTTGDLYVSDETAALTIGGTPAEGDLVIFEVYRVAGDGSDTMAVDAHLIAAHIYYTINAATDA